MAEEELRCEKCNNFIGEDDCCYRFDNGEINEDSICMDCINKISQ